jgi:hypothetical protein
LSETTKKMKQKRDKAVSTNGENREVKKKPVTIKKPTQNVCCAGWCSKKVAATNKEPCTRKSHEWQRKTKVPAYGNQLVPTKKCCDCGVNWFIARKPIDSDDRTKVIGGPMWYCDYCEHHKMCGVRYNLWRLE